MLLAVLFPERSNTEKAQARAKEWASMEYVLYKEWKSQPAVFSPGKKILVERHGDRGILERFTIP